MDFWQVYERLVVEPEIRASVHAVADVVAGARGDAHLKAASAGGAGRLALCPFSYVVAYFGCAMYFVIICTFQMAAPATRL